MEFLYFQGLEMLENWQECMQWQCLPPIPDETILTSIWWIFYHWSWSALLHTSWIFHKKHFYFNQKMGQIYTTKMCIMRNTIRESFVLILQSGYERSVGFEIFWNGNCNQTMIEEYRVITFMLKKNPIYN